MLLVVGHGLSCNKLNETLGLQGGESKRYRVLEIEEGICSITYSDCWDVSENTPEEHGYRLRCACGKFDHASAEAIAHDIVTRIPEARLLAVTPVPFIYPWGPFSIIDAPVKELRINTKLLKELVEELEGETMLPGKNRSVIDICEAALSSLNSFIPFLIHTAGCIDILRDAGSKHADHAEKRLSFDGISYEVREDWVILRLMVDIDYCGKIEELLSKR